MAMIHAFLSIIGSLYAYSAILSAYGSGWSFLFTGAYGSMTNLICQKWDPLNEDGSLLISPAIWSLSEVLIALDVGYFFYDMIIYSTVARSYGHHGYLDWIHHVLVTIFCGMVLQQHAMILGPIMIQTNELSTPLLHLAWYLTKFPCRSPLLEKFIQILFVSTFFLTRIAFDSLILAVGSTIWVFSRTAWNLAGCADLPLWMTVIAAIDYILFVVVQYLWFFAICKQLLTLSKQKPAKDQ